MSLQSRREVVERLRKLYKRAGRAYRIKLVDKLCFVCGYDRKYGIKILNGSRPGPTGSHTGGSQKVYGPDEAMLAAEIWKESDYPCGKRLVAILPLWLPAYMKRNIVDSAVACRVQKASPATLDRLLAPYRARITRRHGGTKPGNLLRTQIPIRCESWNVDGPGYLEADTVDHGGESTAGDFMRSITYTDIFSGWIEQSAIWNKSGAQVLSCTKDIEKELPFPILGFDCDNGGEFLNHALVRYFQERAQPVQFTRSRSYRKNDNAHVEQKNWDKVRQLLGHARFDQPHLTDIVHELYRHEWRLLQNFFQPVMKLLEKKHRGSRVIKRYDKPQTPAQRLLAWGGLAQDKRDWILLMQRTLDPITLQQAVNRSLQRIRRILREGCRHVA